MNSGVKKCPSCGQAGFVDDLCPECGYSEKTNAIKPSVNRRTLWVIFLLLFLGTPVLTALTISRGGLPILGIGVLSAGFVLSRLYARSETAFILMGIAFSVGIFAVYLGVAFVGCIAMMKGSSF